jgi:hypothetical protein
MTEQEKTQEKTAQPNPQTMLQKITPGEDFSEDYANNFTFEFSAWDFKIIFGQTDQMSGQANDINWHTAITMPWGIAKILSRMLLLNVVAGELQLGPIHIPPSVMPPPPPEPTGDMDTPQVRMLYEMHQRLYRSLTTLLVMPEDLKAAEPPTTPPRPPA